MFNSLDKEDKKTLIAWFIVGCVAVIAVGLFYYEFEVKEKNKDVDSEYSIVTDLNRYYTVKGTLEKYYSFVSSEDKESILKILSKDYQKKNKITEDNLDEFITFRDDSLGFTTRLICEKKLGNGKVSYLVTGVEGSMTIDEYERLDTKYFKVLLDGNNLSFAITPISESDFGGECNNE